MHVLSLPDIGTTLGDEPSIKRIVDTALFESLRQRGYSATEDWLQSHRDKRNSPTSTLAVGPMGQTSTR